MFFRKRVRVHEFLERRVGEFLTDDGIFTMEGFFHEYNDMLSEIGGRPVINGNPEDDLPSADRDLFVNSLLGTILWLIKYRTLSNQFNSPRKVAYLDLNFDTVTPEVVDKLLSRYNTQAIKETFDAMDIGCKQAYTGELKKADKPRFLVSPLWARDPDPHPFRIAAGLFIETIGHGLSAQPLEDTIRDVFLDALEKRFIEMTQKTADAAKGVNLI